jgi:hypothetical protein
MRETRSWGIMYDQVRKPPESGVTMRDDYVVMDLIDRAIWDEHFRLKARFSPQHTLMEAGFWNDLTAQEKEAIEYYKAGISSYTDGELVEELKRFSLSVQGPQWGP